MSGIFIAVESTVDDAGFSTAQYRLLVERLKSLNYDVKQITFPRYDSNASYFVRKYISGEYGGDFELGPYTPSLFYALDRYDGAKQIQQWLNEGSVVIADHYIGADKARQGIKIDDIKTRQVYYTWLDQLEFGMLGIPRPDLNIILTVPADVASSFLKKPINGEPTDNYTDLKNFEHIADVYQELFQLFPKEYILLNCALDGELMSIPAINNLIWERVQPMLKNVFRKKSTAKDKQQHPLGPKQDNESDYIVKNKGGSYSLTKAGHEKLNTVVTNSESNVYAFTGEMNSIGVATAMALSSRRSDNVRGTLLDEFIGNNDKDDAFLDHVVSAHDGDIIKKLAGLHFVVENGSYLLSNKLERGRLATYLEISSRYLDFDKKNTNGSYKYHIPSTLDDATSDDFRLKMNELFTLYSKLVADLTNYLYLDSSQPNERRDTAWKAVIRAQACETAQLVLPTATTATVGIYASVKALESLIMHLQSDETAEARTVGNELLTEARKVLPTFLEGSDKSNLDNAWFAHRSQTNQSLKKIARDKKLQPFKGEGNQSVILTEYWPKNELDTLPHMLYSQTTLSLNELSDTLNELPYQEKQSLYTQYFGERLNRYQKPGRALETIHYTFDLLCDYDTFRDLQRFRIVDALEWQQLTPHYGFGTPKLIIKAGLEDLFESCFELSQKLYQSLRDAGYEYESQYATLLGHTMRWKVTMNAREAFDFLEQRTSPQSHRGHRKLAMQMYEAIASVHPLTAEGMIFVNQEENLEQL